MIARALTLSAVILAGGAVARLANAPDRPIERTPLSALPCAVDRWSCDGDTPLDRRALAVLGVDDYVNRTYLSVTPEGGSYSEGQGGRQSVGLYVAYYGSQRQGESIHSPQNCLPGSGWQPVSSMRTTIDAAGTSLPINRYVVQKGLERQVVLYWYQGRGRVVANEYLNKFWLMIDQARLGRSNAALVRIVAPAASADDKALQTASASADQFARAIYPRLSPYLP
jgi:EpsI family protein